ncbi:MAG: hypothetical protein IPM64_12685 [Phycisphaerales bacterium]|nr:hypothetical protein [Phycisphaerales bacterium]
MKSIVLGVVILAGTTLAWLVLPPMLTSGERSAEAAARQATQSARELGVYSPVLDRTIDEALLAELRLADLQQLIDQDEAAAAGAARGSDDEPAKGRFAQMHARLSEASSLAANADRAKGLSSKRYDVPSVTGAGLKQAVDRVAALRTANAQLLASAVQGARSAHASDRSVLGVAQALGNAEFIKAVALFLDSVALREQVAGLHARLAEQTIDLRLISAERDALDTVKDERIPNGLSADLAEFRAQLAEAVEARTLADAAVEAREAELAAVQSELTAARTALEQIETRGFVAGDDAAYAAFAAEYLVQATALATAQRREQSLAAGGSASPGDDEDDTGSVAESADDAIVGLDELKRRQASAHLRAERLERSVASIEKTLANARTRNTEFGSRAAEIEKRQAAVRAAIADTLTALSSAADAAWAKEEEALAAAKAAVSAYRDAEKAGQDYAAAASEQQRSEGADPQRTNPRLTLISENRSAAAVGTTGWGESQMLVGRVLAGRLASLERHVETLRAYAAASAGSFDEADLTTRITDTREAAINAVQDAVARFGSLARSGGATAWISQAAAAAAHHLLMHVDSRNEGTHRASAVSSLVAALERRSQHPSLAAQVRLHEVLTGSTHVQTPATGSGDGDENGEDEGGAEDGE